MLMKRTVVALALVVGAGILFISILNAQTYLTDIKSYVEVCAKGTAYVPRDAKFVRCYGVIRPVAAIVDSLNEDEIECECPYCCDGFCYIFIFTDSENQSNDQGKSSESWGNREVKVLWMPC
jgi:hypothetical protein